MHQSPTHDFLPLLFSNLLVQTPSPFLTNLKSQLYSVQVSNTPTALSAPPTVHCTNFKKNITQNEKITPASSNTKSISSINTKNRYLIIINTLLVS